MNHQLRCTRMRPALHISTGLMMIFVAFFTIVGCRGNKKTRDLNEKKKSAAHLENSSKLEKDISISEGAKGEHLSKIDGIRLVPLPVRSFYALALNQRILAYHYIQACEAGSRILYGQHHRRNLVIKDFLERLLLTSYGIAPDFRRLLEKYMQRFWLYRGHHNLWTGKKFIAPFSMKSLWTEARKAFSQGVNLGPRNLLDIDRLLLKIKPCLFDPLKDPNLVTTNGEDRLDQSAVDFYQGVNESEVQNFHSSYPLNSRLVKKNEAFVEEVYRAGGEGTEAGLFSAELKQMVGHLKKAQEFTTKEQHKAIAALIHYFETGSQDDFQRFITNWSHSMPSVEFVAGFIPTHRDPLGIKGTFQCVVAICQPPADKPFQKRPDHRECELISATGDPGPEMDWGISLPPHTAEDQIGEPKSLNWINVRSRKRQRVAYISPVYLAKRSKQGEILDIQVLVPQNWIHYQLSRSRVWLIENNIRLTRKPKGIRASPSH